MNKKTDLIFTHFKIEGVVWNFVDTDNVFKCDISAINILNQLECEGFVADFDDYFYASWSDLYNLIANPDYKDVLRLIGIPDVLDVAPTLNSIGTLNDPTFRISISGWNNNDGLFLNVIHKIGGIVDHNNKTYLMPENSWKVFFLVGEFWRYEEINRSELFNRKKWGKIRQEALNAKSILNDFLYRSIVLTPEKISLNLKRTDFGNSKVIEIIPTFSNCPDTWLNLFDSRSDVSTRYDIPTNDGIIQIIITDEVKTVLNQVKSMAGRRVAGVRAEAFLLNPFSVLGEEASNVIDVDDFEKAKISANLIFDRFTAFIEKDSLGNPQRIGLQIESSTSSDSGNLNLEFFRDINELENFINHAENKITGGFQLCFWRDYEFELVGDTFHQLNELKIALEKKKKGAIQIDFDQVYDLSIYSDRVEEIGYQKPFYSPFIAKPVAATIDVLPIDFIPLIVYNPSDGGEPVSIPVTPEIKELIKEKLEIAQQGMLLEITIPSFPKPIPISEAQGLLNAFESFSKNKVVKPPNTGGKPKLNPHTLVIRTNVDTVDYEEIRRELLNSYNSELENPFGLKDEVELKHHQITGIARLQHLFKHSPVSCRGVLLADDMGLGKTLQLLTLLCWAFEKNPKLPPALIVAPVSLLENWQTEINKFFKPRALNVLSVFGDTLSSMRLSKVFIDQQLLDKGLVKFLKPDWRGNSNIILTTYETLRDFEFSFSSEKWSIMICDEAQKIKNPNALITRAAKKQNVQFKIACTGTPVENTLTDLWCLFDFVQPGMLGALNNFGQRYRKPIEAKTDEEKARVDELRNLISTQILRRTKQDVAKDLPQKIIVKDCHSLVMSAYQMTIYSQALELYSKRFEEGAYSPFKNMLGLIHYLKLVCTDPRHIGMEATTTESIFEYRKKTPKMDWLINQLHQIKKDSNSEDKVIIFCEFKGLQRLLQHYIEQEFSFKPDIINGDTEASSKSQKSRVKRINAFQDKPGFGMIILSPLAVGFGVNIQAANHVIHYSRTWNPAKEDQATDRAFRIGQTKNVFVYYPVVTASEFDTFDVNLHRLLEYKRELAKDMLNGSGDVNIKEFTIGGLAPSGGSFNLDPILTLSDVQALSPKYFEGFSAALWEAQGFTLVYKTPDSGDDGVDVVAITGDQGCLVQAKSTLNSEKGISWDAIKDVVTGEASYKKRHPGVKFKLCCITNQKFNNKAIEQAQLNDVQLFDKDDISAFLTEYQIKRSAIDQHLFTNWGTNYAMEIPDSDQFLDD